MHTLSARGGILRAARRPPGWRAPGPTPAPPGDVAELLPGPGEDLCWLAGDFRILQRTDGHRFSLDDLMTAYVAAELVAPAPPARILDLGCGIGSVLLFLAWRFPAARVVGVEAQALSAGMARRSIAWNGIGDRAVVQDGDLREPAVLGAAAAVVGRGYDLITGTPPYFPPGTGLESPHAQRGSCRFEHRGGIEAYCAAAARLLSPGAPFVVCEAWSQRERVAPAADAAGLTIAWRQDVVPRTGRAPLFSVYVMRAAHAGGPPPTAIGMDDATIAPPLVVRDAAGRRTSAFAAVRVAMGMPP